MIQMQTSLEVADNSGARRVEMIMPIGGSTGKIASLGDRIKVTVKEASPDGTIKKGTVQDAVIVRTRKEVRRADGTYVRFDQNAAVLIKEAAGLDKGSGEPHANKVGSITVEQARQIAERKMPDLNANDLDAATRIIAGTARSMGVTVEGLS